VYANASYCVAPYAFDYDYCEHGATSTWHNEARKDVSHKDLAS
jgi:hypothetical protein